MTNEPTVTYENVTNEPTVVRENATNEPTSGPLSVVRCPLPANSCTAYAVDESETTNEPTGVRQNVTNEPTAVRENAPNEPTAAHENAPNEPTVVRENARTNPPWFGSECDERTHRGWAKRGTRTNPGWCLTKTRNPNEPTAAHEIATNEPKLAAALKRVGSSEIFREGEPLCEPSADAGSDGASPSPAQCRGSDRAEYGAGCQSVDSSAWTDDRDEKNSEGGFSVKESESILKACERIRLAREEQLRKLNEEARRDAEAAAAIRRFRLGEQKNKNGKPRKSNRRANNLHL